MTRLSSPYDHQHQFKDFMLSCKQDSKQCCEKLSIWLDYIASRTNLSSKNLEVIVFCMTDDCGEILAHSSFASVHSGLQGFIYAQLSDPTMTFQLD